MTTLPPPIYDLAQTLHGVRLNPEVRIVDTFPAGTHAPITYPAAAIRGARTEGTYFVEFLASAQARDTWKKFGFVEPKK